MAKSPESSALTNRLHSGRLRAFAENLSTIYSRFSKFMRRGAEIRLSSSSPPPGRVMEQFSSCTFYRIRSILSGLALCPPIRNTLDLLTLTCEYGLRRGAPMLARARWSLRSPQVSIRCPEHFNNHWHVNAATLEGSAGDGTFCLYPYFDDGRRNYPSIPRVAAPMCLNRSDDGPWSWNRR